MHSLPNSRETLNARVRAGRAYPQALRYDELRRQMEEVAAEKRAMDQAYRQLVRGLEEERESLTRELHDQALLSVKASGKSWKVVQKANLACDNMRTHNRTQGREANEEDNVYRLNRFGECPRSKDNELK